jgi:hypothetical protein
MPYLQKSKSTPIFFPHAPISDFPQLHRQPVSLNLSFERKRRNLMKLIDLCIQDSYKHEDIVTHFPNSNTTWYWENDKNQEFPMSY